ncbi:MAG: PhzF family phenazine biosynthesis protein [Acidobacteriaceae bacterium]|nr:PhzF family phenazine biosynthesis protein [Acidobacteriaceae bacterium]
MAGFRQEKTTFMRKFPYVLMDVFTSKPLEGNQLAVFTDARGLTDPQMQRIAKEMNLSETTFIVPSDPATEKERGTRVRIFTVDEELPFAGHPTLGTAVVLRGDSGKAVVELDLNVGKIPVTFEERGAGAPAFGEMRQRDPEFGQTFDPAQLERDLGLKPESLHRDAVPQTVSTGMAFAIIPVRSLSVLQQLRVTWSGIENAIQGTDAKFLYFVCKETTTPEAQVHARMIFYNGEDPATGSAAGCAAAWLVKNGWAKPDERVMIEQGVEIKRPSQIYVRADREGEKIFNVRVGGSAVQVAAGEFQMP